MKIGDLEKIIRCGKKFVIGSLIGACLFAFDGCDKATGPENQPPETEIISGPSGTIEENIATFERGGNDPDGTVEYYKYKLSPIMNNYAQINSTTKTFSDLNNGNYTFYVKAIDNEFMEDPTPAERNFSVYKEYTLVLQPGSDEGIDACVCGIWENGQPTEVCNENFGDYLYIDIRYGEWIWEGNFLIERCRNYIKFNLDSIPYNVNILDAKMSLYVDSIFPPSSNNINIRIHGSNGLWDEYEITWTNQPEYSNIIENTMTITEIHKWYDFNITNLVIGWLSSYNNGLVLKLSDEFGEERYCDFCSSDYGDSSKHPKLTIEYTLN